MNSTVHIIHFEDVDPIPLPGGSWSRMVLTEDHISGARSSMGYSNFSPDSTTAMVAHEVEEMAFVVQGHGELRLEGEALPFEPGQALFIPPGTWHAVANTGEEEVLMVFTFPYPRYPPTKRR